MKLWTGLALVGAVLLVGFRASTLSVAPFARTGMGVSPLTVAAVLALLGLATLAQTRSDSDDPVDVDPLSVAIILASLTGGVLIAEQVSLVLAIVFAVFVGSLAGPRPSIARNLAVSAVLIVIALALQLLLGLDLPRP